MVKIRNAGPEDAEALARVRSLSWQSAYDGLLPAELIQAATRPDGGERQREFLQADPARHALLAEDGGSPVGMAAYGPGRSVESGEGGEAGAELYVIYVLPEYWSRNVGRSLMDRVLEDVRAAGYPRIFLWVLSTNMRARRFYERYGFAVAGDRTVERDGHPTRETRYERTV
jgi:ribosomal protein S18 acetylase RimI-like enzyme